MKDKDNIITTTFSILAFDPETKAIGSACASRVLAVGSRVPHLRQGVGAVNTQHADNSELALHILDFIEQKKTPEEALRCTLLKDDKRTIRQIIVINFHGEKAAWTGKDCASAKKHVIGKNCLAAGNTLVRDKVIDIMVDVYENAGSLSMANRLLLSMETAEKEGGDRRGKESASLQIMSMRTSGILKPKLDLRIDNHENPLAELRRLHDIYYQRYKQ